MKQMHDPQVEFDIRDAQRAEEQARIGRMTPEEFGAFFAEHRRRSLDVDADFQFASDTFTIEDSIPPWRGE